MSAPTFDPSALRSVIARFPRRRILVLGDVMLDRYLWGRVDRISPEAPVPVVRTRSAEQRPGGAANVAVNVAALGAGVRLATIIGEDERGREHQRPSDGGASARHTAS